MKETDRNITKLFRSDTVLLVTFLGIACTVIVYALAQILGLVDTATLQYAITAIACISMIAMIWAVTAVLHHLKKHKDQIYRDDLRCQDLIHERKVEPQQVLPQEVKAAS